MAVENDPVYLPPPANGDPSAQRASVEPSLDHPSPVAPADQMDASPTPYTTPLSQEPESQNAVADSFSAQDAPPNENGDDSASAPYGTRSRNRTGGARPNYAEDREVDLMIEANSKITKPGPTKVPAAASHPDGDESENDLNVSNPTRRGFAAVNGNIHATNGAPQATRDPIPGTSTFSANPSTSSTSGSKKRKQPGSSNTNTNLSTTTATATALKARSAGAQQSRQHNYNETNMLSFEGCRARLNAKGQLRADDGTILAVNGTYFSQFQCTTR